MIHQRRPKLSLKITQREFVLKLVYSKGQMPGKENKDVKRDGGGV